MRLSPIQFITADLWDPWEWFNYWLTDLIWLTSHVEKSRQNYNFKFQQPFSKKLSLVVNISDPNLLIFSTRLRTKLLTNWVDKITSFWNVLGFCDSALRIGHDPQKLHFFFSGSIMTVIQPNPGKKLRWEVLDCIYFSPASSLSPWLMQSIDFY